MKAQLVKGSTSVILTVFIQDASSTTGAGLGSLDQTSSIVGGYVRMGGTGVALAVDQNVTTEGTYEAPSTAAQVRIGTPANMRTGTYELHFHNDLFATGADILTITLGGATDMADIVIEVQLTGSDLNTTEAIRDAAIADAVWDEILTGATHNIATSAGRRLRGLQDFGNYENGAIWIDTINGAAGTTDFENGVVGNPVDTLADAVTLAASLGISRFEFAPGSSITLVSAHQNQEFVGNNWTLNLNGQTVDGSFFRGAVVTGVMAGTGSLQSFVNCHMGACSVIKNTNFTLCGIEGTITVVEAGDFFFDQCHSAVAGTGTPTFDFGAAIGSTNLNIRGSSGGWQLESMGDTGTDTASIEGWGQIIEGTCTGGTVAVRGAFTTSGITNLTLSDNARMDVAQANITRLVDTTIQAGSTASLLIALAADLPGAGASDTDDIYNGAMVLARDVNSGNKPNIRLVSDYTASTNTFTLDAALDFTPEVGVDTFEVLADPGAAILVEILKLSTGFGASSPDNLIGHLRAMMSKAATAPSGVGTYLPSTDSLETLGEAATAIQGAGFATGTDSLKAIRDAITDLVAPLVVSASGTLSGVGFLSECVSLIRKATDEPDTGPKYPDNDLIEYIHSAFDQVLASINVETDHPILVRYEVPVVQGTQEYLLPCNMAEIWRIAKIDSDTGIPVFEVWPTNPYTFRGDGFTVEGNILRFQHLNLTAETLEILYVAAGDVSIHTGTADAGAADSITFPASPTDGTLDIRPHAYAGYMVRPLDGVGAGQERIVSAYDAATRVATVRPDWTTAPDNTTVYEVLPQYSRLIKHVVACYASLDVLANEAKSERRAEIERQLQRKMSALKMMLAKKVHRFGTQGPGVDTYDNTGVWPLLP